MEWPTGGEPEMAFEGSKMRSGLETSMIECLWFAQCSGHAVCMTLNQIDVLR